MKSFRFRSIVLSYQKIYPDFNVDVEAELEKYKEYAEKLRPLVKDTISYLHNALKEGRSILVEGANAAMLDIDFGMEYHHVFCFNNFLNVR